MKLMCIKELRSTVRYGSELMLELGKVYYSDSKGFGAPVNYGLDGGDYYIIKCENGWVNRIGGEYVITLEEYRENKLKELGI